MILTVAFGKGGTGKTSTACALAGCAREAGRRVLCVDCDPQSNFTYCLGGDPSQPGLYAVLTGKASCADILQRTEQCDLLPAGLDLAAAEASIDNKPMTLRDALEPLKGGYDLIVIDTQPSLSSVQFNALCASDGVLLPMEADTFSMMGLYQMAQTIEQAQKVNRSLKVAGILLTRYKPKQLLAGEVRQDIEQQARAMGTKVFDTYIREGVAVKQAQALQQSLFDYAPKSNTANDYRALFAELDL